MKTLLIICFSAMLTTGAQAAVTEKTIPNTNAVKNKMLSKIKKPLKVSPATKSQFYRDFGNVPVIQWKRTKNFDKATFIKDGEITSAFYDNSPDLVGTTTSKTFDDLPAAAQIRIEKSYAGYAVGDILFFDDNELNETDMVLYDQSFEDADNYFIELKKDNKKIVVKSDMQGNVSYFTKLQ
jgi:hypothetical protein